MGCFNKDTVIFAPSSDGMSQSHSLDDTVVSSNTGGFEGGDSAQLPDWGLLRTIRRAFLQPNLLEAQKLDQFSTLPSTLLDVCLLFRYLVGMALDIFDK